MEKLITELQLIKERNIINEFVNYTLITSDLLGQSQVSMYDKHRSVLTKAQNGQSTVVDLINSGPKL